MGRSSAGGNRALETARKQADKQVDTWKKKLWHLSTKECGWEEDAHQAGMQSLNGLPAWLEASAETTSRAVFEGRGRPARDAQPTGKRWSITASVRLHDSTLLAYAQRNACLLLATHVMDEDRLSHDALISLYVEQGRVERGLRFLKDPLFLASSVCVNKPERLVAVRVMMVLAWLVYRLAEHRLREPLAALGQTIPHHVNTPTARPTMRWVFPCFEGIDVLQIRTGRSTQSLVLRLQPVHEQILSFVGPASQQPTFRSLKTHFWIFIITLSTSSTGLLPYLEVPEKEHTVYFLYSYLMYI